MVVEICGQYDLEWVVISEVVCLFGVGCVEMVCKWVCQVQVDVGVWFGIMIEEFVELKCLWWDNVEL